MFFNILGGFKAVAIIVNKHCHHISYLSSDWPTSSTIDQSDDSFQNVAVLFSGFCNLSSAHVVQVKQSKQLLTKEICLLSEATTYIFPHRNGRGHGGRVVTLLPPTSEAGVRFLAWPEVGKLVVACCWPAVYSTEP